jgi:hypothetical protein
MHAYVAQPGDVDIEQYDDTNSSTGAAFTPASMGFSSPTSQYWADAKIAAFKCWDAVLTTAELERERWTYLPKRYANIHLWSPFISDLEEYAADPPKSWTVNGTPTEESGPPIAWGSAIVLNLEADAGGESASISPSASVSPSASASPSASLSPSIAPDFGVTWGEETPAAAEEAQEWPRWRETKQISVVQQADNSADEALELDSSTTVSFASDTTTGNAIVVKGYAYNDGAAPGNLTVTDSKSNVYSYAVVEVGADTRQTIAYHLSPVMGAGHTVTIASTSSPDATGGVAVEVANLGALADASSDSGTGTTGTPGALDAHVGDWMIAGCGVSANDPGNATWTGSSEICDNAYNVTNTKTETADGANNPSWTFTSDAWLITLARFSPGDNGPITITGDADWGKASIDEGVPILGNVLDLGDASTRTFEVEQNKYGTGDTGTVYIRGSATTFDQFDGLPVWIEYTAPTEQSWRYVQLRQDNP